jgi:hypothetical protein
VKKFQYATGTPPPRVRGAPHPDVSSAPPAVAAPARSSERRDTPVRVIVDPLPLYNVVKTLTRMEGRVKCRLGS